MRMWAPREAFTDRDLARGQGQHALELDAQHGRSLRADQSIPFRAVCGSDEQRRMLHDVELPQPLGIALTLEAHDLESLREPGACLAVVFEQVAQLAAGRALAFENDREDAKARGACSHRGRVQAGGAWLELQDRPSEQEEQTGEQRSHRGKR
ncbi:MAG: hypothetical protein IPJ77_18835 [Planctomycetes bacterium]|nr:hypothetical protein [Planctomycetota bacterium]